MWDYIDFAVIVINVYTCHVLVSGDIQFCPESFTADGTCDEISCGNLALFQWPASKMPHSCKCAVGGSNKSNCTCLIVC